MAKTVNKQAETQVPDPTDSYERSHPEHESGQGRLDNNTKATPTSRPDKMPAAVGNAQDGSKQINAHDVKK
jgi:hypothetical protein